MQKIKEDPARENRIEQEIIVDAYDESEKAMGWYYYLEDKIHFPFKIPDPPENGRIRPKANKTIRE